VGPIRRINVVVGVVVASHFGKSMTPSRAVCPLDPLHSLWPKDGHSILPLVSWSQNNAFIHM